MKTIKSTIKKFEKEKFNKFENDIDIENLEFSPEVYEKIERGIKDIEEGRYMSIEKFIAKMEAKYHINE